MIDTGAKTFLLGAVIFYCFAAPAFPGDDIRVEGIVHDTADPAQSVAILNGVLVKQGDRVGSYKIVSIGTDAVTGVDESSGKEMRWAPAVSRPEQPALKRKPLSAVKSLEAPEEKNSGESASVSANPASWNPFDFLNASSELQAITDLHQIQRAAMIYHETHDAETEALDLKKLGSAGLIPTELAGGVNGKYRYSLTFSRAGFEISADPSDPASRLRHFYIGQDGVLRAEQKNKATAQSPFHEY